MSSLRRRTFVLGGLASAGAASLSGWAAASAPARLNEPFTLGVASGDPAPDGMVLWTRLAPTPMAEDGQGGMPDRDVPVEWQVAEDSGFRRVVAEGIETARRVDAHTVHAEPRGLRPGREYHYRFRAGGHISPVGRTRTAPPPGIEPAGLDLAIASCQNFESGWYHAYRQLVDDRPDLVLFLGDYIYDRAHMGIYARHYEQVWESETLAQFRIRYAENRARDPQLRAAHAAAPWLVIWDDHEVDQDWNATRPVADIKSAAFRAYWEHMPLRRAQRPAGPGMPLYREIQWGALARFHMLDSRQYRDAPIQDTADCAAIRATDRTMLGEAQERSLLAAFSRRSARWDFLAQQVPFAMRDDDGHPETCDVDRDENDMWEGYPAARDRITRGWVDHDVRNMVVLTGDIHSHWANDLKLDYFSDGGIVGTELIGTSITSPYVEDPPSDALLANSPHLRYLGGDKRGYLRVRLTGEQLTSEFMTVSDVLEPDPAKVTITPTARYVVEDARPGLHPA